MKEQMNGALVAPRPLGESVSETVNALTGQVSELQKRYYRSLAPDCEVKCEADRWYLRAIAWTCAGLLFPPLLAGAAVCVCRARKCRKGGER